jgi:hypothetical protein
MIKKCTWLKGNKKALATFINDKILVGYSWEQLEYWDNGTIWHVESPGKWHKLTPQLLYKKKILPEILYD